VAWDGRAGTSHGEFALLLFSPHLDVVSLHWLATHALCRMSAAIATKPKAGVEEADAPQVHRIRITLTSRNVSALEKTCSDLLLGARSKSLSAKGPVRMPTKTLRITTRKTPNGEGSKTWDRFEMRIHKRLIDLKAPTDVVKSITSISIEPGVDVEVSIVDV
jgi:small subunit ribosomal protein S20e